MCRLSLEPGARGAAPGRFSWQSVSIETPGKRLWNRHPEVFTGGATGYLSPFGPPNSANTAPLPWGDRLFATWDGGRPVELHPGTLEFVAEVGHVDSWGGSSLPMGGVLPFLLSSAHPVADPERDCLWSVKLDIVLEPTVGMRPSLVRWDRDDGSRVRHWPLDGITFDGSAHTVSQTRDWVILSDSGNFKADAGEMFGGERTATIDDEVPVWLIRKDALEGLPAGTPITPTCFTMAPPSGHYYARWDDTDGISVVWEGMDLMDLGLYLRPDDVDVNGHPVDPAVAGLYNMAMAPETITEVVFDPESGKVLERGLFKEDWTFNLQLSAMDWSTEGMSSPTLHHVDYQGCRPGSISARAATLYEGRIDLDLLREETPGALCSFERGSMDAHRPLGVPRHVRPHHLADLRAPIGGVDARGQHLRRPEPRRTRRVRGPAGLQRRRPADRALRRRPGRGRPDRHVDGHQPGDHPAGPPLGLVAGPPRPGRRRTPVVLGRAHRRRPRVAARRAAVERARGGRRARRPVTTRVGQSVAP